MPRIFKAAPEDAARILDLQRRSYEAEARLYDDWDIPPLTQTVESIREEIRTITFLKALDGDVLVGSIRASADDGVCLIGRLVVEPTRQRQGIGGGLLRAIEALIPDVNRYELFTGHKSEGNIRLYRRHGYETSHSRRLSDWSSPQLDRTPWPTEEVGLEVCPDIVLTSSPRSSW